jgi:hypothetical protein
MRRKSQEVWSNAAPPRARRPAPGNGPRQSEARKRP